MPQIHVRVEDATRIKLNVLAASLDIPAGEVIARALAALERELKDGKP